MEILRKIITVSVLAFTLCTAISSQERDKREVHYLVSIKSGFFIGDNDWSFKHPIYYGSRVIWETVEGKASGGLLFEGGIERMMEHLGTGLAFGIKPSEITVYQGESIDEMHIYNFNTNYLGIRANYFFGSDKKKVRPYIGAGFEFIFLTGESKTRGASYSIGGGINVKIADRLNLRIGADWKTINYINYVEGEGFDRTIRIKPVIMYINFLYDIHHAH